MHTGGSYPIIVTIKIYTERRGICPMAPYLILAAAAALLGFLLCELHPSRRNDIILLAVLSAAVFALSVPRGVSCWGNS